VLLCGVPPTLQTQTNGVALSSPQWLPGGVFQLTLIGQTNQPCTVQVSADLILWSDWTHVTPTSLSMPLTDPEAARHPQRFYRAVTSLVAGMVWIGPGTFTLGSPDTEQDREADEGPQTQVTISQGFWMAKYEVTQEQYQAVIETNPSYFTGDNNRPVETVSWIDATNYCAALTARERSAGRLPAGYEYRLPTEAEWEYACRAGTATRFSYGDDPDYGQLGDYAWYFVNSGAATHAVGAKQLNAWGLYDMHGNVWEWCLDWYGPYPGGSVTDPRWPQSGIYRVIRGGSWDLDASACRSAFRHSLYPASRQSYFGFRVVLASGQR
jgi:formylglycine-generating enzyme required for sulfatase activity